VAKILSTLAGTLHAHRNSSESFLFDYGTLNVTTVAFNTVLQSQRKGRHNMLQHFLRDPLYTLPNSLFQVISICKICSHHQYWQDKFQGHHFWHVPKGGSLVLGDRVASRPGNVPKTGNNHTATVQCCTDQPSISTITPNTTVHDNSQCRSTTQQAQRFSNSRNCMARLAHMYK
jgi:hypothetical protein